MSKKNPNIVLEKLKNEIFNPTREFSEKYSASEAFCAANFNIFLPNLDYQEHKQKFKEVFYNQYLSLHERIDLDLMDNLDLSNLNLIKDNGFILCSFHYGAYKLLSCALVKSNRKFFIVTNNSVTKENRDEDCQYFNIAKKRYGNTVQDELIHVSVQNKNFIYQSKQLISEGYIMLIYIDGNSGLDGVMKKSGKNMAKVTFLNQNIFVKQGLPVLSYVFNTPILPVFSLRQKETNVVLIESCSPIHPDLSISRINFGFKITQELYSILEQKVIENPFEWEGWLYVHKWLDTESLNPDLFIQETNKKKEQLSFNQKKYVPFILSNKIFLLSKDTHLAYEADSDTKKIIAGDLNSFNQNQLDFYINKQILI